VFALNPEEFAASALKRTGIKNPGRQLNPWRLCGYLGMGERVIISAFDSCRFIISPLGGLGELDHDLFDANVDRGPRVEFWCMGRWVPD